MENQLPPELADLKAQIELIGKHGISPEKLVGIVDEIINGDLADPNYKRPTEPLAKTADKQKHADRIIKNYNTALNSLVADKKAGKDDETKSILKLSIIVGAASAGLHALGYEQNEINAALGLATPAGDK